MAITSLDVLIIIPMTAEADAILPASELPRFRQRMNAALLALAYDDPFEAWSDLPLIELSTPLHGRLDHAVWAVRRLSADARRPLDHRLIAG